VNDFEVDMDTLFTFISGMTAEGDRLHDGHYVFDNITPYMAFKIGKTLGGIEGVQQGVAANDN